MFVSPLASASTGGLAPADEDAFAESHARIVAALRAVTRISEVAVTEAARALGTIVEVARAQADETSAALRGPHEESAAKALERQAASIASRLAQFDERVETLSSAADEALDVARELDAVTTAFDGILLAADVLTVHMRVESARMSPEHQHVGVIADQLELLAADVARLSSIIGDVSTALREDLPDLARSLSRVQARRRQLATEVGPVLRSIERAGALLDATMRDCLHAFALRDRDEMGRDEMGRDEMGRDEMGRDETTRDETRPDEAMGHQRRASAAAAILGHSQEALSRLQYHDPMAQDLEVVDRLVARTRTDRLRALDETAEVPTIPPLAYAVRLGDSTAGSPATGTVRYEVELSARDAGEVLLF